MPGKRSRPLVRASIADAPAALEPLRGRWELVWGPAVYRSLASHFADALMYVARSTSDPDRYVVSIRGTNPLSAFDWIIGDFWAGRTTPWRYAADGSGAALSLSTSFGLSVLQSMRWEQPEGVVDRLEDRVTEGTWTEAAANEQKNLDVTGATTDSLPVGREMDPAKWYFVRFTAEMVAGASSPLRVLEDVQVVCRKYEIGQ